MARRIARLLCFLATGMLASCFARQPSDLRTNGIERLTLIEAGVGPGRPTKDGSSDVLKIDVATSIDLKRLAGSYGTETRFMVIFCGSPMGKGPKSYIVYPDLLSGSHGTIGGGQDRQGVFHYTIFVYISYNGMTYGDSAPYDLSRYPRDICISTRGGNETGFGFKSNDAVASAAQIMAALRKY